MSSRPTAQQAPESTAASRVAAPAGTGAAPFPAAPGPTRFDGIDLVRWPQEAARREELARRGEPCVLVIGAGDPAPLTDLLEDWVREPVDTADLGVRCAALHRRTECGVVPTLDDGLLLYRGAWAAVPTGQLAMVELLLARLGRVVTREELAEAAAASGGSGHGDAVKAALNRLARRVAPLGLELRAVRGRGYLLELPDRCPLHTPEGATNAKDSRS